MTEQEWLNNADTYPMLEFLRDKASDRKLRLFAGACCRRIWHILTDGRSRKGVELAERYADGKASRDELTFARTAAWAVSIHSMGRSAAAAEAAAEATWGDDEFGGSYHASLLTYNVAYAVGDESEWVAQCRLLREIIGNPFRLLIADSDWLTPTVVNLAQTIYDDRAFDRMPKLADALVQAGFDDEEILGHCRGPGPHVRGCWALDMVLGKE